jgi:HEAT repeat protein
MPITMEQVRAELDRDEPNYERLARLGPAALPHLEALAQSDDPLLASKATYASSLIPGRRAAQVLQAAATSPHDTVRVAAAAGARNLDSADAREVLERLLGDGDTGVRKFALRSTQAMRLAELKPRVEEVAASDAVESLRSLATQTLQEMNGSGGPEGLA